MQLIKRLPLIIVSSILMAAAHPPLDAWWLAWFAFVPLFIALDGLSLRRSFWMAYLAGVVFFGLTIYWFIHVTLPGAIGLIVYFAVYYGVFGVCFAWLSRLPVVLRVLSYASAWVCLEYGRAHLLSGFGWVSLGYSQYTNLPIIQIADIVGVYGVSFLIFIFNILLFFWIKRFMGERSRGFKTVSLAVLICFIAVLMYGQRRLSETNTAETYVTVSVIQPNIGHDEKWIPEERPGIVHSQMDMTRQVLTGKPELVVWPETSFPGIIWESPELFDDIMGFAEDIKQSLLVGAITEEGDAYFNSAILINKDGYQVEQYNKLHLVPFGEYLPLRKWLPFLSDWVPIEDFSSGKEWTLFSLPDVAARPRPLFAVLICFEDTVPYLARQFVLRGAGFLVNMTNDGWFKDSAAPLMHMQASVFRAVENRRALVRSANTGVSAVIDPNGRIRQKVEDGSGQTVQIRGMMTSPVAISREITVYTKWGDVFTYVCFACILILPLIGRFFQPQPD